MRMTNQQREMLIRAYQSTNGLKFSRKNSDVEIFFDKRFILLNNFFLTIIIQQNSNKRRGTAILDLLKCFHEATAALISLIFLDKRRRNCFFLCILSIPEK